MYRASGTKLTFKIVEAPHSGSIVMSTTGEFTWRPSNAFELSDSFKFVANDGATDSNAAMVEIEYGKLVRRFVNIESSKDALYVT